MRDQAEGRGRWIFVCMIVGLYGAFLLGDMVSIPAYISNKLKFMCIVLCCGLAALAPKEHRGILSVVFALTLLCDGILLFYTRYAAYGILLFTVVQILNALRLSKHPVRTAGVLMGGFVAIAIAIGMGHSPHQEWLLVHRAAAFYAWALLTACVTALVAAWKNAALGPRISALGMVLFFLCDVNVAARALLWGFWGGVAAFFMWFFYVPAQVLLVCAPDIQALGMNRKRNPQTRA